MNENNKDNRRFFHNFPRPRAGEDAAATLKRGIAILTSIKNVGLVLAPEVVKWDIQVIAGKNEPLRLLQRRASFTELSLPELALHSRAFGPISLSCDIGKLREIGAMPVIYAPQGVAGNALSQIATFCVNGVHHTRLVLTQLQRLKEMSNPELTAHRYRQPVDSDYKLILQNPDNTGNTVASYDVPALLVQQVLAHVSFNSIPFNHSIAILDVFANIFYPTDNAHAGDQLGYYRQREWRLIASDIAFDGKPMCRSLTPQEVSALEGIDSEFWTKKLEIDGRREKRSAFALIYDPIPSWNFLDLVECVYVPADAIDQVRDIVGTKAAVMPTA